MNLNLPTIALLALGATVLMSSQRPPPEMLQGKETGAQREHGEQISVDPPTLSRHRNDYAGETPEQIHKHLHRVRHHHAKMHPGVRLIAGSA